MAGALTKLTQRVNAFVDRERNFTRDASHELRSPLTVIRMAADLLLAESSLDDRGKATVNRIKRAATDMVELVETFLMLARETEIGLEFEPVSINAAVEDEVSARGCQRVRTSRLSWFTSPSLVDASRSCSPYW